MIGLPERHSLRRPEREVGLSRERGLLIAWIAPGEEPTRHALGELARLRPVLESWGGAVALGLVGPARSGAPAADDESTSLGVPVTDPEGAALAAVSLVAGRPLGSRLPVVILIDAGGEIVYLSEGYRVGVGEQVLRAVRRLPRPKQVQ